MHSRLLRPVREQVLAFQRIRLDVVKLILIVFSKLDDRLGYIPVRTVNLDGVHTGLVTY